MVVSLLFLPIWWLNPAMTLAGLGRVMQVEKGRTLLYVSRKLAGDSAFPFQPGERVLVTIDAKGKRLIVERAPVVRAPAAKRSS